MNIPSSSSIHRNAQPPNYLIQQHRQQSPNTGGNTTMLYLDGTNSSSRTPPYTTTASSSMEAGTNGQVQHPGHHRDKLDLIRDSLRPFEQLNEQFSPNNTGPTSSMTSSTGSNSEPSEEVQRTMINALIQGGFDREAAYYALKLVNFNSVMDAAKVLSNIKQNLTQQQLHMQHAPTSNHNNRGYGSVSPSNDLGDNLTQQALSSQSRAALSRYGVVSHSSASPLGTTINIGGSTHWQAGPSSSQQHYSSNKPVVVTQSLPHQYHHPNYEGSFGSGSSSRSSGSPPIYGSQQPSANIELSAAPRAAQWSNGTNWIDSQQQQKRHLKAAQSIPHTKNYHSIEESDEKTPPPSSSRSTQDHHAPAAILRRQTQMPISSPTVIKIERNASDRIPSGIRIKPVPISSSRYAPSTTILQVNPTAKREDLSSITTIRMSSQNTGSTTFSPSLPIQNIRISTDQTSAGYVNYTDQLCSSSQAKLEEAATNRCVSPLPETVANRLKTGNYERFVKPCRAPMFRFFMEQHIEKLVQQYRERNQRAMQLSKEMEMAGLTDQMKDQMLRLLRQKESKYIRLKRQKMNKNMFDMIRHIGVGAFGKVTLVRKKDTSEIYAMKTLSKEDVIQKQQAAHVKAERDILAEANSNWIVKLYFSFQDAHNLYFIMEYVPGGDMMQLLINKGIFSERLARFYVAELTCAIEYVHSLGFIHRDIKPDNILIDKNGHIKLTDFGLCTGLRWTHDKRHYVIYDEDEEGAMSHLREDSFSLPPHLANGKDKVKLLEYRHHKKRNQAHSVVGTGNYMAPEVIKKIGHTQLCDWWSVGVILYEMVYGRPPFLSQYEDANETQYMIVNWRRYLHLENPMGARLSRSCVDIIAKLCCDTDNRLGSNNGAKDIKSHIWFRDIDFTNLRSTRAEFIPRVEHPEDTRNFDTFEVTNGEFEGLMAHPNSNSQQHGSQANGQQQKYNPAFFDFTFRHFFASDQHGAGQQHPPPPGFRPHQQARPSLAPLIEATTKSNGSQAPPSNLWTANKLKTVPAPAAPVSNSGKR